MQLELPPEGGMLSGVSTEEDTEVPPLLSAECHQTEQVPGSSPGWIPEERLPTLKRQTSLGKYLAGASGGSQK